MKFLYTFIIVTVVTFLTYAAKTTEITAEPIPYEVGLPEPAPAASRLTDRDISDYEIYADVSFYSRDSGDWETVGGNIDSKTDFSAAWDYLTELEAREPIALDENDEVGLTSEFTLTLTDRETGALYAVSGGILYDNPGECGGPCVLVVEGVDCGGGNFACYGGFDRNGTEYSVSGFRELLTAAIAP